MQRKLAMNIVRKAMEKYIERRSVQYRVLEAIARGTRELRRLNLVA